MLWTSTTSAAHDSGTCQLAGHPWKNILQSLMLETCLKALTIVLLLSLSRKPIFITNCNVFHLSFVIVWFYFYSPAYRPPHLGNEYPLLCWCAVKTLLTHSLCCPLVNIIVIFWLYFSHLYFQKTSFMCVTWLTSLLMSNSLTVDNRIISHFWQFRNVTAKYEVICVGFSPL